MIWAGSRTMRAMPNDKNLDHQDLAMMTEVNKDELAINQACC